MELISQQANKNPNTLTQSTPPSSSRYENQKRRDWNTFCQYLRNHRPPLSLPSCSGAHVLEFLRYLDQFGKTKVHHQNCAFFGLPNPPAPCPCPLRQAWGSLDALIGRLRAAYEENGGPPEANPFGSRAVRLFLREVRDFQSKARGVSYEKKRKRVNRLKMQTQPPLQLQQQQEQQPQQDYERSAPDAYHVSSGLYSNSGPGSKANRTWNRVNSVRLVGFGKNTLGATKWNRCYTA
ncbi:hypothetical protein Bca4012_052705 [Brassica carinata]